MSHRPRLGRDGRLMVPEKVVYDQDDFLRVRLSDDLADPFEWTDDRLLLAESFARTDFRDKRAARRWSLDNGAVDRLGVVGRTDNSLDLFGKPNPPAGEIWEHVVDIEAEQANVRWHLTMLERLSAHREEQAWSPDWGHVVIDTQNGDLIVGGPEAGVTMASPLFADPRWLPPDAYDERLRQFVDQQTRLRAATEGWPTVAVGHAGWPTMTPARVGMLGSTWDTAVELDAGLIRPYVAEALERRFTFVREPRDTGTGERAVLLPREERTWQSVLLPIYLQLFEALRRITEGEPGAATCRECSQPFLVLDARRRFFCNDRERTRFNQRERRRRLQGNTGEDEG